MPITQASSPSSSIEASHGFWAHLASSFKQAATLPFILFCVLDSARIPTKRCLLQSKFGSSIESETSTESSEAWRNLSSQLDTGDSGEACSLPSKVKDEPES